MLASLSIHRAYQYVQAAIYDKALRRKDASGVLTAKEEAVSDRKKDGKAEKNEDKPDKPKEPEKKSNADSGKVVNLMAGEFPV